MNFRKSTKGDSYGFETGQGMRAFEALMPYRIREVLLVSSLYDAFILREDTQVGDLLVDDTEELGRSSGPRITRASSSVEGLDLLGRDQGFDLIIVTPQVGEMGPLAFAEEVRESLGRVPIVLLGYDVSSLSAILASQTERVFDEAFLWSGDSTILRSIVALIEDRANCLHDTEKVGVQAVLLVEDSLNFLSSYLPLLYGEIVGQVRQVLTDGVNLSHKLMRMRARPKILLARDLRTAKWLFEEHQEHLLGVISDVAFPLQRGQDVAELAGFEFARVVRKARPDLPILMQSSDLRNEAEAVSLGTTFVGKNSPYLHLRIREFMLENFGFGPFLFRAADGHLEAKARSIRELRDVVEKLPLEILEHHAGRNDFSIWLRARTAFALAEKLKSVTLGDFASAEEMRTYLVGELDRARTDSQRGVIADFDRRTFDRTIHFSRIGGGSLGGKARGLAFLNYLLPTEEGLGSADDVRVHIPQVVVITTELFDRFMRENELFEVALGDAHTDVERRQVFLQAELPEELVADLRALLTVFEKPLSVRSSSLLEDAHAQPFAGVYETLMVANCAADEERLIELCHTIKLVYASTFNSRARSYLRSTSYSHEEEKMAVVIQEVVGRPRNGRFYPSFSGVARSHNYYPHGEVLPEHGVVSVGLGLGKLVVAGEGGLRFCPRFPQSLPDFSTVDDILANAQRRFYGLDLTCGMRDPERAESYQPEPFPIEIADEDGTLAPIGSVYSPENETIFDGISRPGHRLVSFAGVLKHGTFPLARLTRELLELGAWGMGCPVEIEFAVELDPSDAGLPEFALLQMRPMVVALEAGEVDLDRLAPEQLLARSERALGNGRSVDVFDIVFVDPAEFERNGSAEVAAEISALNARLCKEDRPYLLIGPGRWGSADPWLGIPVDWAQISGARIVVETGFENFAVRPSEGSHFFHNMTSFGVAYFTLNPEAGEGVLNLDWLRSQEAKWIGANGLRHLQLRVPVTSIVDGSQARGAILLPVD
ncbi:MAG: CheY-like chemotaxis protein [Planctomycetota bacterium]|jgi:CheY-like chemotaxis protein